MKIRNSLIIILLILASFTVIGTEDNRFIQISPLHENVAVNQIFMVEIVVSSPTPLLVFQCDVVYNSSVIHALKVIDGGAFETWGENVYPGLIRIDNVNGSIKDIVAYSVNGSYGGVVATIEFKGISEGWSYIKLENVIVGDEDTIPVEISVINGSVDVTLTSWDVNMDGKVNVLDMIIVSQHWMETPDSPNWYPRADVNGDGVVNILDLILVGQHFST